MEHEVRSATNYYRVSRDATQPAVLLRKVVRLWPWFTPWSYSFDFLKIIIRKFFAIPLPCGKEVQGGHFETPDGIGVA